MATYEGIGASETGTLTRKPEARFPSARMQDERTLPQLMRLSQEEELISIKGWIWRKHDCIRDEEDLAREVPA